MKLINLYTLHMDKPLGIDCIPYFSWQIQSNKQNVVQVAYQLRVLHNDKIIWDTGRLESSQSTYVIYQGPQLQSRIEYTWDVIVWDNHGNKAQAASCFEMALLAPEDWIAKWVEAPFSKRKRGKGFGLQPPATMFRRNFYVRKSVSRGRLYATCHGVYQPSLNGQSLDNRTLAPEHTSYGKYLCYQTYDVTKMLQEGNNALGFYVGDGWYNCPHTKPDIKRFKPGHAILFQLEVQYEDGTIEQIVSDDLVKCATGPVISSDLFAGELYDANLERPGWDCADYDDSGWKPVKLVDYDLGNLRAQLGEPVRPVIELPVQRFQLERAILDLDGYCVVYGLL